MKKTILVAAASLFVIGQALAQGQTPPPAGAGTATQSKQTPNKAPAAPAANSQTTKAPATNSQNAGAPAQGNKAESTMAKGSKKMSSKKMSSKRVGSKRSAHRMSRSHRGTQTGMMQGKPQQQGFGFAQNQPQKLTCKKGQKPDGITCM